MPPRDDRKPFGFPDMGLPDMTIPDNRGTGREPARPAQAPQTNWNVGDRVLAPWEPQFLYVGSIAKIEGDQAQIQFDDGDAGWVLLEQIRPLAIDPGLKVLSRKKMGQTFAPGQVVEVRGDEVCVAFDDGHQEWTRIGALRIPCQPQGQGASPTKVASHMAFLETLQRGDRVWAPWSTDMLFVGTVDQINEREAHIHFDDGDRGWVLLEQLVPFETPPGMFVLARRNSGGQYYPGVITQVDRDGVYVEYDDGHKGWTTSECLALPCDPYGPSARATRGARPPSPGPDVRLPDVSKPSSGFSGIWIAVAIGIGLLIFLFVIWSANR